MSNQGGFVASGPKQSYYAGPTMVKTAGPTVQKHNHSLI